MTVNAPTPSQPAAGHRRRIQIGAALAVIPLVAVLAACGGSSSGTPAASAPAAQAPTQGSNSGGAPAIPGASGLIAAATPGTLQVQSATAQNTVVYTAATKFTSVTTGHVAAGDCVIMTGTPGAGSAKALTATSVRIDAKVNGACPATGAGGGFGGGGSFASRPPGAPSGRPSGGPSAGTRARRAFASAIGTVSSVAGSTIVVNGVLRNGAGAAGSTTAASPSIITVTLAATATVTQTIAATSAAAVVGQCAAAIGPANSVGAISAKSITISIPGPTGCRAAFGGFGGRGGGAGGSGANPAAGAGSNA
jgi:hypothetical protein